MRRGASSSSSPLGSQRFTEQVTTGEVGGLATPEDDDPSIPDADALYRRLSDSSPSMVAYDQETGERLRPSSGAFKPDPDGVSVYRRSRLEEDGLSGQDVARHPWNLVASVDVGEVRSIALGVRDDPWPSDIDEAEHPRNRAHALITGLERLGKNGSAGASRSLSSCRRSRS